MGLLFGGNVQHMVSIAQPSGESDLRVTFGSPVERPGLSPIMPFDDKKP